MMNISGTTRVFVIVGDPVAQVRAPELFNHLFARHGIDAVLVPAQVAPEDLPGFVAQAMKARNFGGLWVAIPHKGPMVPLLQQCDRLGRSADAVNAVRRRPDGSLEGALFDGLGLTKALDHFGVAVAGRRTLVVGVGGGGAAVATSLASRGAARVTLHDLAADRTEALAARLSAEFGVDVRAAGSADPAGHHLVIHATPLGLKPDDPLPFDVARLDEGAVVVDILMKNQPTPLLRACHARGIEAYPGFEMLVQQVPEYLSFFGYEELARAVQADASDVRRLFDQA
ncbi:shikimate dehydrogenase [Pelomonas sp. KK5]|uniref:shikimate dehydrogenase family protein n=1 Tax=Pelomonas sp. KK5 TaxID=1855730 RepID=UPI001E2F0617|nr:shikimate dehydrogenase [Pelomonas sp. KK5]